MTRYLLKHALFPPLITPKPHPGTGLIVVIPCFNEPGLVSSLQSLWNCARPKCNTEVIVMINAPGNAPHDVITQNELSMDSANQWINHHNDTSLRFFIIKNNDLPLKHAGVGLARKIGMDEAVYRFNYINRPRGIIICFDADSGCDGNYLVEIENHFKHHPDTPACSIYFEHPVAPVESAAADYPEKCYQGIIQYELYLRYFKQGLMYSGHPAAFHTIGSAMAVRADIYCQQGGMNKRKAGEDFYFLNKVIPLGNFTELNSTRVIPSPRPSARVPFGTGKAIMDFLKDETEDIFAAHPQSFEDLKFLCDSISLNMKQNHSEIIPEGILKSCPLPVKKFLEANQFTEHFNEIMENSSSGSAFIKRFYKWFDAFMVLKMVHFLRDYYYNDISVARAANQLLWMKKALEKNEMLPVMDLLNIYRKLDRQ